jgi:nifR3 family TIM-barrel protein
MPKPLIALAPMADYTDQPFSLLCREIFGHDFIIFREMVSSEAIVRNNEKTLKMCAVNKKESPVIIQICGDKPATMAAAAKIITDKYSPDGIDINMGCPVPKITRKTKAGAALMRYPELAVEIIEAIKAEKLGVPLSVKTRLGWDEDDEVLSFALQLEKAGIDRITIHGRTKVQGYSGKANWSRIAEVKRVLKIPVIANGDILAPNDIKECLKVTGADGVMIGRGALGNPWILAGSPVDQISIGELLPVVRRHADLHVKHYGERGMITFRKHLLWYFHGNRIVGLREIKKIRASLARVSSLGQLDEVLSSL